jgi:hypothetical protein
MMTYRSAKHSLLAAAVAMSAIFGGAWQASASVVDTFSVSPNPITEGGQATIDLALNISSDFLCNTQTCYGFYNAQFSGGSATIYDGIGGSQTFNIGSGGNSRDFQLTSTYSNANTWHPSFSVTLGYSENYEYWQYQYSYSYHCGFLSYCTNDVYGWTQYTYGSGTSLSGSTDLTVNAIVSADTAIGTTPLPAALPLFASGLGALGMLGWRRKRKAAAIAA